jgi:hypothetical protein
MGKRSQERALARDAGRSFKVCSLIALAAAGPTPDFLSFFLLSHSNASLDFSSTFLLVICFIFVMMMVFAAGMVVISAVRMI